MIEVTSLAGKKYWINPHQIESMEQNPDLTITFLSGKKLVVSDKPEEIVSRIIKYRNSLNVFSNEL